ncbi:ROK family protein [Terrimonas pollutisoli]|uniref:ROK family protein n=1 Tax=Terrimonas pollutisoli TaxID=3034147 RepID=UPI0023EAB83F|nr:ROK family protein [Terrimonas sp. H1YJ31]
MGKKWFYKGLILREFYFSNVLSCADVSERINKSLPFTAKILDELVKEGQLIESGYAPSSGGRRPLLYTINLDTTYILSVAMDQLITRISIMNVQNKHTSEVQAFELPLQNNPDALSILADKMNYVVNKSGIDKKKIIGAGIGMPGFLDYEKGINYSFLQTKDKTIVQYLSEKLELPVYIDNDSSLIALAELRFGAARNRKNAMVINIGWGVGLGMVLNGGLFRGHNGFAGEFSHIPLFNNNKLCSCGKTGCLETETSLLVIIEKAKMELKEGRLSSLSKNFPSGHFEKDYKAIISAALKGDQFAVELLSEVGFNIGKGVAILIHLMNPESIIISGRGAMAGKMLQTPIQQALNKDCIPWLSANTEIELSTLGHDAELIGSAALVMESQVKEKATMIEKRKVRKRLLQNIN